MSSPVLTGLAPPIFPTWTRGFVLGWWDGRCDDGHRYAGSERVGRGVAWKSERGSEGAKKPVLGDLRRRSRNELFCWWTWAVRRAPAAHFGQ